MDARPNKSVSTSTQQPQDQDLTDVGFLDALRSAGMLDPSLLQWATQESKISGKPTYELLSQRVPAIEHSIYSLLAEYLGVEFESLDNAQIDQTLAQTLDSEFALANHVAPLTRQDGQLVLVTSKPKTLLQTNLISTMVSLPVQLVLGPHSRLERFIQRSYGLGADTVSRLLSDPAAKPVQAIKVTASEAVKISTSLDSNQEASVTTFVNQLLVEAVKSHASDIHIEPYEEELRIRFRIDGVLQEVPIPAAVKQLEQAIVSRVKVLGDLDIAEKRLCQDGQIRLTVLDRTVDIRVSVLPSIYGESIVLRILDRQSQFRDLGEIGMPADMLEQYRQTLSLAQGLILVAGPTGSGKTTTLYASLNHVSSPGRKIITVEDPVEYRLNGITQIQAKDSIGLDFSTLLRSIVRHDPDVLMVGEIRDTATANMALNAAITGHLVLATIHTNDAPTAVTRLAAMGAPRYMIAAALKVAVAQRLVRVLCPHCKRPASVIPPELQQEFPDIDVSNLQAAHGCDACRHTGYRGRMGIFQSLPIDESLRPNVLEDGEASLTAAAYAQGMTSLRQAGIDLVKAGITTLDEVHRVTRDVQQTPQQES